MMEPKKERLSNFELLRLISMFLIVMWHTTLHSGVYGDSHGMLRFILDIVMCFCLVHVNSLVMLTGYFQCNKKNGNFKKVWKVLGTSWFYKVAILIFVTSLGIFTVNSVRVFQELMPIDYNNYWFINNYIVLFLMSPFLNRIINYCTQGELKKFVLILFITLSIIPTLTNQAVIQNDGYGLIHFILIYFIGAYIRKYPIRLSYHFKNLTNEKYQTLLVVSFFVLGFLNIMLYNFGTVLDKYNIPMMKYIGSVVGGNFLGYYAPIPILMTITYFLFFETLTIKNKWINRAAETTFGIYLIHDSYYMRNCMYKALNVKDAVLHMPTIKGVIVLVGFACIIYISAFTIDSIRILISNGIRWLINRSNDDNKPPKFLLEDPKEEPKEKPEPRIEIKKIKLTRPKENKETKDTKETKNNHDENPDSLIDF